MSRRSAGLASARAHNMRNHSTVSTGAAAPPAPTPFHYPGLFSQINARVMQRADEPASQLMYYLYTNKSKKKLPTILKRNWAAKLESLNAYQVHKYKNAGIGMIDVVRICHAHSEVLDELMKTGNVTVAEEDRTWETMRSAGASTGVRSVRRACFGTWPCSGICAASSG